MTSRNIWLAGPAPLACLLPALLLMGCGDGGPAAPETHAAPTVATADLARITANWATGGGNVTSDGGARVTARGVVWSTSAAPTLTDNLGKTVAGAGEGEFTCTMEGLDPETTYHIRAYAINSQGTAYGREISFTTGADPWSRKADNPGAAQGQVAFAATGRGYVGTGTSPLRTEFWAYNPALDAWSQTADLAGVARSSGIAFSVGDKGYIGMGFGGSANPRLNDFWEYDPASNEWTQVADFPGAPRIGSSAVAFTVGDRAYLGTGTQDPTELKDLWQYHPGTNSWTRKADFPGPERRSAVGFAIGNKGYVGGGFSWEGSGRVYHRDFWEYDPGSDSWTRRRDFPGPDRAGAAGFSLGGKGYLVFGTHQTGLVADMWEYDPVTDTWMRLADFGDMSADFGGNVFTNEGRAYVLVRRGYWAYRELWEFDPSR
jgi:N-acetylneuraminic acid mutarotase